MYIAGALKLFVYEVSHEAIIGAVPPKIDAEKFNPIDEPEYLTFVGNRLAVIEGIGATNNAVIDAEISNPVITKAMLFC